MSYKRRLNQRDIPLLEVIVDMVFIGMRSLFFSYATVFSYMVEFQVYLHMLGILVTFLFQVVSHGAKYTTLCQ